jgi:hypothetical protein
MDASRAASSFIDSGLAADRRMKLRLSRILLPQAAPTLRQAPGWHRSAEAGFAAVPSPRFPGLRVSFDLFQIRFKLLQPRLKIFPQNAEQHYESMTTVFQHVAYEHCRDSKEAEEGRPALGRHWNNTNGGFRWRWGDRGQAREERRPPQPEGKCPFCSLRVRWSPSTATTRGRSARGDRRGGGRAASGISDRFR